MTREEAIEKIKDHKYNPQFLDMLEALGLIKFDEVKEKTVLEIIESLCCNSLSSKIPAELEEQGYLIVKRDKITTVAIIQDNSIGSKRTVLTGVLEDIKQD